MTATQILGEKYILNGIAADATGFQADMSADIYYEVIRIIGGKFLFLKDHLLRLRHSIQDTGLVYPGEDSIRKSLKTLIMENHYQNANIRICLQKSSTSNLDLLCYFVPWVYPDECTYLSGVQLITYDHVRPSPGIKKWDDKFRTDVKTQIREHGVYEALLLNQKAEITEGSRSNVFFIDDSNRLRTPPEENILPGITRKYVLQICREENISIEERPVSIRELGRLKACFISGTSPKVLPVWQVDNFQFRVDHPTVTRIMEKFEAILGKNLETIV